MFDRPVEEPDQPEAVRAYRNTLGKEEQVIVCREYLWHVDGWDLFNDWLQKKSNMAVEVMSGHGYNQRIHEHVREYCEQLGSFWDFVCAEA